MAPLVRSLMDQKQKRARLNLGEQAKVTRQRRRGADVNHLMHLFKVSCRTIFNIKKKSKATINNATDSTTSLTAKTKCAPLSPHIAKLLYEFVTIFRVHRLPTTCSVIQQRAFLLLEALSRTKSITDSEREKLQRFTASKSWILNFVKRLDLRTVSLNREAERANALAVAHDMIALQSNLKNSDVSFIFNVDETGRLYKVLPRQTYIVKHEERGFV